MATLELKSGDDITLKFTIKDADKAVIDITGGTIRFKIAPALGVTNANAEYFASYTGPFTDPTNGIHKEKIPDSVTKDWTPAEYKWQVRFIDSAGDVITEDVGFSEILQNLLDDE